jgi:hypothetical protein
LEVTFNKIFCIYVYILQLINQITRNTFGYIVSESYTIRKFNYKVNKQINLYSLRTGQPTKENPPFVDGTITEIKVTFFTMVTVKQQRVTSAG